jgi:hypothetical protein
LTGKVFGELTAVCLIKTKDMLKKNVKRSAYWLCKCSCGREKIIQANSLTTGNSKTCGDCSWGRYEVVGDYVIGYFEDDSSFIIDVQDYELVSKYRWWKDKNSGYFITTTNGCALYLHRLLLPDKEGLVCDHRNRDKSDNRRVNLRYATKQQNSQNRSISCANKSGYIGVCWHIRNKKFHAGIRVNGKTLNLGYYHTAEEAARVRDKAALQYYGDFANLNFGGGHEQEHNEQRRNAKKRTKACENIHVAKLAV